MQSVWRYLIAAALGGLVGGFGNALLSDTLIAPKRDPVTGNLDFGWIKNVFVGFFSGIVWLLPNETSWKDGKGSATDLVLIALQTLIIGLAGSAWLTAYLNNDKLKGAVAQAASAQPDNGIAAQIAGAKNVGQVLEFVKKLNPSGPGGD
jgi:hypothetical protein